MRIKSNPDFYLTTGSHNWNITHKHLCIFIWFIHTQSITFILPLSLCYENGSIFFQISLFNCSCKKAYGVLLILGLLLKLRYGNVTPNDFCERKLKGEKKGFNCEPRDSAHLGLLLYFCGLYITLYVPNLFLLFTYNHIHMATFSCKRDSVIKV